MPAPFPPYDIPTWTPPDYLRPTASNSSAAEGTPIIDVTPTTVEVSQPTAPLPITTRTYSRIVLADFARHKFFSSTPPGEPPEVTQVRVWWDRFRGQDDTSVRLYLNLPQEQRAYLIEHGYNDDSLGEEPLIDDTIMQEIREAQEAELASATDPTTEAGLRQEHAEQLEAAKNEKIQITPDHLLRYPFERTFEKRIEATRYKATVERYIQQLKKSWMKSVPDYFGKLKQEWETVRGDILRGPYDDLTYVYPEDRPQPKPEPTPDIPFETRFEGTWIVGRQGTGKTQLFQHLLLQDLDMVAAGKAVVVVLDPTGDKGGERPTLIHNLTRLKRFAPGGDLHGKLIYIDPTDKGYTLPINLLSLRPDMDDDEAISSAIGSYLSVMSGLMGQPLTKFQDPVFRWGVQVALAFPNPTLETLQSIIAVPPRPERGQPASTPYYQPVFDKLHPAIQQYLTHVHDTEGPRSSRNEIMTRLTSLNADPLFRRIFNADTTKIDFSDQLTKPNVIVINASRDLSSIKELYGRYFLSLIKQAAEARKHPFPCFIYIDECNEFVANDKNAAEIILKLRRNRVALTLGNQQTSQIQDAEVREAFKGTAIKFINSSEDSARELAASVNLLGASNRPDIAPLMGRPRFNFAFFITGETEEPITYTFKPFQMEAQPKMSEGEWQQVRQEIRNRYYEPIGQRPRAPASSDQIAAILVARRLLENTVRAKVKTLNSPNFRNDTTMLDMLRVLEEQELIDPDLRDTLHRLRKFGNTVAHDPDQIVSRDTAVDYCEAVDKAVNILAPTAAVPPTPLGDHEAPRQRKKFGL